MRRFDISVQLRHWWRRHRPGADHRSKTARWLHGLGIEIGAHNQPIPGIRPIYVDKFSEYAGAKCLADFRGDACDLPFYSNSLDYVATSHVLEHTANPVKALCEWYRVLRPGGIMYLVVPDRRETFDRDRAPTPCAHLFEDYLHDVTDHDPTHVDEYLDHLDWRLFQPGIRIDQIGGERDRYRALYRDELAAGREINIHFHVFEPANLRELFAGLAVHPGTRLPVTIVDIAEYFPRERGDGILVVAQAQKRPEDEQEATLAGARRQLSPNYPALPTAARF